MSRRFVAGCRKPALPAWLSSALPMRAASLLMGTRCPTAVRSRTGAPGLLAALFALCAFCGVSLAEVEAPVVPSAERSEVDYEPLRAAVARVITTPRLPPCVLPANAVLLSYTNAEMFPLLQLQRRALEVGGVRSCLQRRFLTVCLDAECHQLCTRFHVPNCVDLGIQTVASDFLKADYLWITYIKHEIMEAGLQGGAEEVFFFDTDVVLFGDPWAVKLQDSTGDFDLRYQVGNSAASKGQCSRGVNGGQIYLRRTNTTLAYLAAMRGFRAQILATKEGGTLDQGYMALAAEKVGLKRCGLDATAFLGRCNGCYDAASGAPHVSAVVGMHVDCTTGTEQKTQILTKFVAVRTAVAALETHGIAAPVTIKQALIC